MKAVSELSSVTPAIASDDQPDYTALLLALMQAQGITSFKQLAQVSGWSEKALRRLRRGQVGQMQVGPIGTLAHTLNISTDTLIQTFSPNTAPTETVPRIEYERLQTQLAQQRPALLAEFQQASLATLEPWLLQWSAAAYAAQQNPQAPAVKLLPLLRPVEKLLADWGIEPIGTVGTELPFDPQHHQILGAAAATGDPVRVRYAGYRQGEKLLYRCKVSLV
jgi:transcriptional regulator with XRE-family HTH domain